MIKRVPYTSLGHADHGWLDARHHFSFARYWNPERTGFGALRVVNDDRIAAGRGFEPHPHDNMEIITYVRQGAISHRDSMGNAGRTAAGDVQVMSAGSGVVHSEHNRENEETRLYQIWILPNKENVTPRWEAAAFPKTPLVGGALPLLVSGRDEHAGQGALYIHADAAIYGGRLAAGSEIAQTIKHQAYVLASAGTFMVNGIELQAGDAAEITGESSISVRAAVESELLIIDIPTK